MLFSHPASAADSSTWNAKWIWPEKNASAQTASFQIDYDTQIINGASGFIFGAADVHPSSGLMWQFRVISNKVYFRPHTIQSGKYTLLGNFDISNIVPKSTSVFHVSIDSENGRITTKVNDIVLPYIYSSSNLTSGENALRESGSEAAWIDNIIIKNGYGELIRNETFCSSTVYGSDVKNGRLTASGKTYFLPSVINPQTSDSWADFRKTVNLTDVPDHLTAKIAVDTKYWLWINGEQVVFEGGLKRGPTRTDTWYDTVDIAPYLKKGKNTIAILAHYYGKNGFSHVDSGKAGLIFDAEGNGISILSDASWIARKDTAFIPRSYALFQPNYRLSVDDSIFDARLNDASWISEDYNDSKWQKAEVFGSAGSSPWNNLYERSIPQWKDSGLKDYENADVYTAYKKQKTSQTVTLDMQLPYNAQVTPYLMVDAPEGLEIKISTDHYQMKPYPYEFSVKNSYITKNGIQSFECLSWLNGEHVYYTIPAGVKIIALKYRETGYNTEFTGSFSSDDTFYNKLWEKAQRTVYINMRDNFMDCPDRERAAWTGDLTIDEEIAQYAFDTSVNDLYKKSILTMSAWQKPSGIIQTCVPSSSYTSELPDQELAALVGIWQYYLYTGDLETLNQVYPMMKKYLQTFQMGSDGLIVYRRGDWDWGDHGKYVDKPALQNAWYYYALSASRNAAEALGKTGDTAFYTQRMDSIKNAYNRKYWNGSCYKSGSEPDDRANAIAVLSGIADSSRYSGIANILTNKTYSTPYMEKYVLDALIKMDRMDLAQSRIKSRYSAMVQSDESCSTLWEMWDLQSGSNNHGWAGGPLINMSRDMAGIAPTSPGYTSWTFKPDLGSLNKIDCTVPTVKGSIHTKIIKDNSGDTSNFNAEINVPDQTQAEFVLPCDNPDYSSVQINGKTVFSGGKSVQIISGIEFVEKTEKSLIFKASPGNYTIALSEKAVPGFSASAHVSNIGWMSGITTPGSVIGAPPEKIEALRIKSAGQTNLGLRYSALVSNHGWTSEMSEGETAGTTGQNLSIEAVKISLSDTSAEKYDIYYRTRTEKYGWLNWTKNGSPSGTEGYHLALTGLQICILPKGQSIPDYSPENTDSKSFRSTDVRIVTVSFDSQGGSKVASSRITAGSRLSSPQSPVKENARFTGWYCDADCVYPWDFSQKVTENMTLYAGWKDKKDPDVSVSAHVQNIGWMNPVQNGGIIGTTGRSLRMEAIKIHELGPIYLGITASAHVQDIGWMDWTSEGGIIGTEGQAKRIEAIKIKLSNLAAEKYDIYYRVHAQNIGWMNWAKNGEPAGTAGYSYRLESIQIQLVPKGSQPPAAVPAVSSTLAFSDKDAQPVYSVTFIDRDSTLGSPQKVLINQKAERPDTPVRKGYRFTGWYKDSACTIPYSFDDPVTSNLTLYAGWISESDPDVEVNAHVQNIGWMDPVSGGAIAGTFGKGLRVEALILRSRGPEDLGLSVSTHVQNIGWMNDVPENQIAGTSGKALRLEALKIKLSEEASEKYDIYYRVHAQNIGWMNWAKNGEAAGTAGFSYRLEAVQIKVLPKGATAPDSNPQNDTAEAFIQK